MARTPQQTASYTVSAKVTDKGQVSVYIGERRFPVTLHAEHWNAILASGESLRKFMGANASKLQSPMSGGSAAKGATQL